MGRPTQVESMVLAAPVAQLDRASGFEPEGREFESLRARKLINDVTSVRGLSSMDSAGMVCQRIDVTEDGVQKVFTEVLIKSRVKHSASGEVR